jgi:hypothetical protein
MLDSRRMSGVAVEVDHVFLSASVGAPEGDRLIDIAAVARVSRSTVVD